MDLNKDFETIIAGIVRRETRWLRHYIGEVVDNNDTIGVGRVKVTIPELGYMEASSAVWCFPRQDDGISVPVIGSWVEVYFIAGDSGRPVYIKYAGEISGNTPSKYDKNPKTRILFESPETGDHIKFDETTGTLTISMKSGMPETLILETGDAAAWCPNVLAVCPYSTAIHGGINAGIIKLKGA